MAKKKETEDRPQSSIADLMSYCNENFGEAYMEKGDSMKIADAHYYSTGMFILDFGLSGGLKDNSWSVYVGNEGAGKTTGAYKTIAAIQKRFDGKDGRPKKYCAYVNLERAYDPVWARFNGVNTAELILMQPDLAEKAVDMACAAYENDEVALVVVDSIPALVGQEEFDKNADENLRMGYVARPTERMLRKMMVINSMAYHKGVPKLLVLINQWRQGISTGPMPAKRTMPGGKLVNFFPSNIIEFVKSNELDGFSSDGHKVTLANEHSFKTERKQRGNSIKQGSFLLSRNDAYTNKIHGYGVTTGNIDDYFEVVNYAQDYGLIKGAGTKWYLTDPATHEVIDFGSKRDIIAYVRANPDTYELLKRETLSLLRKSQGLKHDGWW